MDSNGDEYDGSGYSGGDSESSGDGGGYNNGFERGTSDFQLWACQPIHHRHEIEVIW